MVITGMSLPLLDESSSLLDESLTNFIITRETNEAYYILNILIPNFILFTKHFFCIRNTFPLHSHLISCNFLFSR